MAKCQVAELLTHSPQKWRERVFQKNQVWVIERGRPLPHHARLTVVEWEPGEWNVVVHTGSWFSHLIQNQIPFLQGPSQDSPSEWHVPASNILPHIDHPQYSWVISPSVCFSQTSPFNCSLNILCIYSLFPQFNCRHFKNVNIGYISVISSSYLTCHVKRQQNSGNNNSSDFLNANYVFGTVSRAVYVLTHWIIATTTWGRCCYGPQFTLEETEARNIDHLCPSHTASKGMILGSLTPELCPNAPLIYFFPRSQIPKGKQSWKSEAWARNCRQDLESSKVWLLKNWETVFPWPLQAFVAHYSTCGHLWHGHQRK